MLELESTSSYSDYDFSVNYVSNTEIKLEVISAVLYYQKPFLLEGLQFSFYLHH